MAGNEESVGAIDRFHRIMDSVSRYAPILYGWGGMIAVAAWALGYVETESLIAVAALNSFLITLYGHHALNMGWYDAD